ncbi:sensor histidine kinase [Arcobacter sp. YIC-464]|uniref:sensor histidine kinase n=1 Tax=Arcobacter sp. YIC-464 TaxID=3376631 RepID=UPI003C1517A6
MKTNISIKKKLLIYNIIIQFIILIILSLSIYKTLKISTLDKMQTSLKVIILDVVDDILDHKTNLHFSLYNEEKEYNFSPLYIRLVENNKEKKVINSTNFPSEISINDKQTKKNSVFFNELDDYIVGNIIFDIDKQEYIVQVATDYKILNSTLENLFYILLFIIPIVLIFSITGGYFLIYKSFKPIEEILSSLKLINASDLSQRVKKLHSNDEVDLLIDEINNLLQRLEISFKKINQFSSDASHELKTPLTIIRGEIEIALRKDRDKSEYKNSLEVCLDEVLRIQNTIDDLLFLAKNDTNISDNYTDIYLDEITLESISELKSYALSKEITLEANIKDMSQIKGYPSLLKVAIKNLIKNAINFSFENSVVKISCYKENKSTIISVEDTGIGIAKDEQERIFEEFYRTDKSRNKNSGGTGLGMAICNKIVKIHNGTIELESEVNNGTIVKIIL